jgi:small-conductance mechanosensitive channel
VGDRVWIFYKKLKIEIALAITIVFLIGFIHSVQAQIDIPTGNQVDGYPVVLDSQVLFRIREGIPGVATAEERASILNQRLNYLANDLSIAPDAIRVEEQNQVSVIVVGETILYTVGENDRVGSQSRQETAIASAEIVKSAIEQYRQDRSAEKIAQGILLTVLSTLVLIVFLIALQRFVSRALIKIRLAREEDRLDLRIRNLQLLGSSATSYLLFVVIKVFRLLLTFGSFYLYIPFVLSQFPATRAIGNSIFNRIGEQINQLTMGFAQYLPNLAVIIVIAILPSYIIQFAKLVIAELGREDLYPWFYPEWTQPTNRLMALLLIATACMVAAPYLPGFGSPAFQGISIFLGALFTIGSSSAIANAIAGIILTYTRSFRLNDIVQIGESKGKIIEKSLFVVRLLSFKREVITIPNVAALNNNVTNYSAIYRESKRGILLHTTITLGYDVPWRKIHHVLVQAAIKTPGIQQSPSPFVLQTALNDFNISYELNVYLTQPEVMPLVYSKLHQNIQDDCNQAGIEILSPNYAAIRDGNHITIPTDYLPSDYTSPTFQIGRQDHQS